MNRHRGGPECCVLMTVTDRRTIAAAAALVAGLPVVAPGVRHCPADFGGSLELRFLSRLGGRVLADVVARASGCGEVSIVVRGSGRPALEGGPDLIARLGALLNAHWPGPSPERP